MRDQETDREGNGLSIFGGPSLELNRSRSSQLSCLGDGIPSLVGFEGQGKTDWIERRCLLYSLPLNDEAKSGRRDLNPQPQPWQGYALPLSYFRQRGNIKQRSTTEQFTYHLKRTTSVFPPDHTPPIELRARPFPEKGRDEGIVCSRSCDESNIVRSRIPRTTGPRPRSPLRRTIYRSEELVRLSEACGHSFLACSNPSKELQIRFYTTYDIPFRPSLALRLVVQRACPRGYYAHRALASPPELRYRFAQLLRLPRILNHHVAAKAKLHTADMDRGSQKTLSRPKAPQHVGELLDPALKRPFS
ncbi:hypothetical protein AHAS_Ahas18G0077500 [Arachis hypogaea]